MNVRNYFLHCLTTRRQFFSIFGFKICPETLKLKMNPSHPIIKKDSLIHVHVGKKVYVTSKETLSQSPVFREYFNKSSIRKPSPSGFSFGTTNTSTDTDQDNIFLDEEEEVFENLLRYNILLYLRKKEFFDMVKTLNI